MTEPRLDLRARAAALQAEYPVTHRLDLQVGPCAIRVSTNSAQLDTHLRHYFRHYFHREVGQSDPQTSFHIVALECPEPDFGVSFKDWPRDIGKQGRKDTYLDLPSGRLVRKVRTGMQFLLLSDQAVAVGPCLKNQNQVINLVNSQYLSWMVRRGYLVCHSAAVIHRRVGLAMSGVSGAGKSTLALNLLSRGYQFVSNDRLLVGRDRGGFQMSGVPKMPRINPGTILGNRDLWPILTLERLRAVEAMPKQTLWELEEKYDADIEALYGADRVRSHGTLHGFVVLTWSPKSPEPMRLWRGTLRQRPELLLAISKHPGVFHTDPQRGALPPPAGPPAAGPYMELMGDMPLLCFSGGVDFDAAAEACEQFVQEHGS